MTYDIELNSAAHYPVAGIVELSPRIEQARFGAFWKGESNSADPLILLSGIATRTKTPKLGTAIYHIYGRSAVTLGVQSATLRICPGGRLLLGLGVANKTIASWHGGVFDRTLHRAYGLMNMGIPPTIKEIAARVRAGAVEAGRDPNKVEIIAKVLCP